MNNISDWDALVLVSEMAKKHKDKYYIVTLADYLKRYDIGDFSFHPNGNCGCLLANDDMMFGIRCDHLIWVEGYCEESEDNDMIIVFGNHKGTFMSYLIVFN